jgi:two-component system chemotaxis response regulator CheB
LMREGTCHGAKKPIRVLVGEDSRFMRRMIVDTLNADPCVEVVGTGSDGCEVLRKVVQLKPDCVTLDLEMPKMNGIDTLRYIMSEWPTPVIVLSAHTAEEARMTFECLECGAVDFIAKTQNGKRFPADELIARVKTAAAVDVGKVRFASPRRSLKVERSNRRPDEDCCIVLIGASTGGPQALMEIIPKLPSPLPACVIVVQHMPPNFTRYLAERLAGYSHLVVREAREGDVVRSGLVMVAPGGMHLFLEDHGGIPAVMLVRRNEAQRSACPSVDFAMTSFADVYGERTIGVVLTGMGRDGTAGCGAIRRAGGRIICQDERTSMVYGMPGSVIESGIGAEVLPLDEIARGIVHGIDEMKSAGKLI